MNYKNSYGVQYVGVQYNSVDFLWKIHSKPINGLSIKT